MFQYPYLITRAVMAIALVPVLASVVALSAPQKSAQVAPRKAVPGKPVTASVPTTPTSVVIKETTTLADVLRSLQMSTGTVIRVDPSAAKEASTYTIPPTLVGVKIATTSLRNALHFLTSTGWEGSKIPADKRGTVNKNYQLARTPHCYRDGLRRYWVCNNRAWDWQVEKESVGATPVSSAPARRAGRAGQSAHNPRKKLDVASQRITVVKVLKRVTADGDIQVTQPIDLGPLEDKFTFRTILQILKAKTGVTVNTYGSEFSPETVVIAGAEPKFHPMTLVAIPADLRLRLEKPVTIGNLLSLLCIGLNNHTASVGGDWKWSSYRTTPDSSGHSEVIYAIRDYAHP